MMIKGTENEEEYDDDDAHESGILLYSWLYMMAFEKSNTNIDFFVDKLIENVTAQYFSGNNVFKIFL